MPCFLLTFGDASRPPVGAVIIQAPSMFQAAGYVVRDANGQAIAYIYSRGRGAPLKQCERHSVLRRFELQLVAREHRGGVRDGLYAR